MDVDLIQRGNDDYYSVISPNGVKL